MKTIGIIFAMKEELEETKKQLKLSKKHQIYNLIIYECIYNNNKCFLVESGIGKVNAARTTQILISELHVDIILNVGVAGSISKDIQKCDIVVASKLAQHDFDITVFNHEKGYIPQIGKYIEADETLLNKVIKINKDIKVGVIASGDIFVSDEIMARKISFKFKALCVEMEGAAIAEVCYLCKIPFLVLKSISDSPSEENNNLTHEEYLEKSSKTISNLLIQLLNNI